MAELTPMMKQYLEVKEQYKDCILFYRLGDFYEMFFDDALTASRELEITLTGRNCGEEEKAPMCGVPFHAAEGYIAKLISKGYKVGICEQLEDASATKGIVKRDVIRVVTPGTLIETNMLSEKENNYIMSVFKKGIYFGIAVCDISTGDFYASEIKTENNFAALLNEISKYMPSEIIVNPIVYNTSEELKIIKERFSAYISQEENFLEESETIKEKYNININDETFAVCAINGLLSYLRQTQKVDLEIIKNINIYKITKYMGLDMNARRNLELTEKMRDKSKVGTLLWVLDKTATSMGGRQLKRWINSPLIDSCEIQLRLDSVKELKENFIARGDIKEALKKIYDIERLIGKISYGNANARDLISLKNSVKQIPALKEILGSLKSENLSNLYNELDLLEDIYELIENAILEEPPITIKEGGIIKQGYNPEVDELKKSTIEGKTWIVEIEAKEREKTGIKNLKVGFNKIFGYYIEITKSYLDKVPEYFIRKQTLANCERYITEELKEIENKVLRSRRKDSFTRIQFVFRNKRNYFKRNRKNTKIC